MSLWPRESIPRALWELPGADRFDDVAHVAAFAPVTAGLPPTGVHILRHTAAKLRRDAGESIESVSQFLDHSSLAVTTVYLRRLEGQTDESWGKVAESDRGVAIQ